MSEEARDVVTREFLAHRTRILGFLYSLTGNPHVSEDLLQETALVLLKNADKFEPGSNFFAWAVRVGRYKVLEYGRESRRTPLVDEETYIQLADAHARMQTPDHSESDTRHALRSCVDGLPAKSRKLIDLRYEHGHAVGRIAEIVKAQSEAIQKALSRLRRSLRECVERKLGRTES